MATLAKLANDPLTFVQTAQSLGKLDLARSRLRDAAEALLARGEWAQARKLALDLGDAPLAAEAYERGAPQEWKAVRKEASSLEVTHPALAALLHHWADLRLSMPSPERALPPAATAWAKARAAEQVERVEGCLDFGYPGGAEVRGACSVYTESAPAASTRTVTKMERVRTGYDKGFGDATVFTTVTESTGGHGVGRTTLSTPPTLVARVGVDEVSLAVTPRRWEPADPASRAERDAWIADVRRAYDAARAEAAARYRGLALEGGQQVLDRLEHAAAALLLSREQDPRIVKLIADHYRVVPPAP